MITSLRHPCATGSARLILLFCWLITYPAGAQLLAVNKMAQTVPRMRASSSVRNALRELESRYNVTFGYAPNVVENLWVTTDNWSRGNDLEANLSALLTPLNLMCRQVRKGVFIIKSTRTYRGRHSAVNSTLTTEPLHTELTGGTAIFSVKGRVTDDRGEAIPGASVLLKGSQSGTVTDVNGNFSLSLPDATGTLVFSYIGYVTQEVVVNEQSTINVSLKTDTQQLGEVVVVGYGT